jgi:hypothetical protein
MRYGFVTNYIAFVVSTWTKATDALQTPAGIPAGWSLFSPVRAVHIRATFRSSMEGDGDGRQQSALGRDISHEH